MAICGGIPLMIRYNRRKTVTDSDIVPKKILRLKSVTRLFRTTKLPT